MEHLENSVIKINGQDFNWPHPTIAGRQVLELAHLTPAEDYEILMKLTDKELEPVDLDESKDVKHVGIETFVVRPYNSAIIFIDDEEYSTLEAFLTPYQILEQLAKLSAEKYYLKQILEHKEVTYKNDMNHRVAMKNNQRFTTCKIASTTVS